MPSSGRLPSSAMRERNAAQVMEQTGDIPQNVNFALKTDIARRFLSSNDVRYESLPRVKALTVPDVIDRTRSVSVRVLCYR
ncbi:MAG: hypothetical protein PVI98_13560 [Burkholderiales bacterium]